MNLESLTKQQIILLTLLISFITSIATGIVTVTLMDQAPQGVTRTINRVVERTVEKIVPNSQGASVITKEKTIVIKEEDLITDLIEKGSENIVKVYKRLVPKRLADKDNLYEGKFIGIGSIINPNGVIALGKDLISQRQFTLTDNEYYIQTNKNSFFDIKMEYFGKDTLFVSLVDDEKSYNFNPIEVVNLNSLKLGQSVIVIDLVQRKKIITGIISSFDKEIITQTESLDKVQNKENSDRAVEVISKIETNIIEKISTGTPLFNLLGGVIAIALSSDNGIVEFIPAVKIKAEYNEFKNSEKIDSN